VLQSVAVCEYVYVATCIARCLQCELQRVALCCSVLHVCCSVLQCVSMCVLQRVLQDVFQCVLQQM